LIPFIIIIIIIITISFIQGIYTYIPKTNHVSKEYNVAAILSLLFMAPISLVPALALMYFYISTLRSMYAVSNMAVFCSSLTSWFPGVVFTCFLNDFEMVPVAPIIIIIIINYYAYCLCVCKCVMYCCHRVSTQLRLNKYIYIVSYISVAHSVGYELVRGPVIKNPFCSNIRMYSDSTILRQIFSEYSYSSSSILRFIFVCPVVLPKRNEILHLLIIRASRTVSPGTNMLAIESSVTT
jgi:hypothetical protein